MFMSVLVKRVCTHDILEILEKSVSVYVCVVVEGMYYDLDLYQLLVLVMAVLVSKVNFKSLQPKIMSPLLNASRHMKKMYAVKTQTVI